MSKIKIIALILLFIFLSGGVFWGKIILDNKNLEETAEKSEKIILNKEKKPENELRFGWLTDVHLGNDNHEDKMATFSDKAIKKIIPQMIEQEVEFVVNTGDMIDNFHKTHDEVIGFHQEVQEIFNQYPLETYWVLGNHDVQTTTKKEVLDIYKFPSNHYVFQKRGITFIVLDQQFNPDGSSYDSGLHYIPGSVPLEQLEWLEKELEKAPGKVILLTHQPIYSIESEDGPGGEIYTYNGQILQEILEKSGKILAILSGHRQPAETEKRREFGGIKNFLLPSPIFKDTRLSYGIIKINLDNFETKFDYYMDSNHTKLKEQYDQLSRECRGPDEENDYYALLELKKNDLKEFQKIEKLFEKNKNTDFKESKRLSESEKKQIKDFQDYDCFKRYLEFRLEFWDY